VENRDFVLITNQQPCGSELMEFHGDNFTDTYKYR